MKSKKRPSTPLAAQAGPAGPARLQELPADTVAAPLASARYDASAAAIDSFGQALDAADRTSARGLAFQALREEARAFKILNRISQAFAAELDVERVVQIVTEVATELSGAAFGAFVRNIADDSGARYELFTVFDTAREGVEQYATPDSAAGLPHALPRRGVVRLPDITRDPRYAELIPHFGVANPAAVRSCLAAPVISRSGQMLGGLFFAHPDVDVFTRRSERVISAIAVQAAIAIDNAQLHQASQRELAERAKVEAALKASEARYRQLVDQLREADRRKDEFLAVLAHELRNPLAPISNALHIMQVAQDEPSIGQARRIMTRQLAQMVRLIDDLMDISRISRGKIELRTVTVDVAEVVASAIETSLPLIEALGHRLQAPRDVQPMLVLADTVRLGQVFSNLLNNAAKYTPHGGRIEMRLTREGADVVVRISDNGVGIAAEMLPRIFEMFAQLDPAEGVPRSGLGIGLNLARELVDLHGGTLEAASAGAGRGACFTVRLPAAPSAATTAAAVPASAPQTSVADTPSGRRVLIADDNHDSAESLAALFELLGNQVHTEHDGLAAVGAAEQFRPHIVLLDIGMPGIDGFEACRRMRAQAWSAETVIVAITGWGQDEHKRKSREVGFDLHLVKPADLEVIEALLRGEHQRRRADRLDDDPLPDEA
ncbi:MAG: ATP-binding protein [Janthinobacterium lividum]